MKELVALAKEKPDALNYGSYGNGSQPHLLFEMLGKETGAKIQQISYRGIAPAITAVLTGDVQMTLGSVAVAAGHIEAKKLKALAIGRARPGCPRIRRFRPCAKRASRTSSRCPGSACSPRPERRRPSSRKFSRR